MDMATMDIMARDQLSQDMDIMAMDMDMDMVMDMAMDMDMATMDIMARDQLSQDMDIMDMDMVMVMAMVMDTTAKHICCSFSEFSTNEVHPYGSSQKTHNFIKKINIE